MPHVNLAYLSRPKRYLRRHFAGSRVSLGFVEQASLLRRIQEERPAADRLSGHAARVSCGFLRPQPARAAIEGALQDRVRRLDGMIYDRTAMRRAALSDRYAADSEPVPLDIVGGQGLHQLDLPPA